MRKEIHKKKVGELLHKIAEIEINLDIKKIEYKELEEENKKLKTIIESIMKKFNMKEIGMGDEIIMKIDE